MYRVQNILLYRAQTLQELKSFLPAFEGLKDDEGADAKIYANDWLFWGHKTNVNLNATEYLELVRIVAVLAPDAVQNAAFEEGVARHLLELTEDAKTFIAQTGDLPWLQEDLTRNAKLMKLIPVEPEVKPASASNRGGLLRWISKICNFNYSNQK